MSSLNKVQIIGRLGADPELKSVGNSTNVCKLNVATSETWLKNGEKQERTEWHRVSVWGKLADLCNKYLEKGKMVYIEGKLQTRQWETENGEKRYSTEVVASSVKFLSPSGQAKSKSNNTSNDSKDGFEFQDFGPEPSFNSDDEIPF